MILIVFGVVRYGSSFYSSYNIFDAFLNNNTYYALIALGMTFVIISGGIDLSVGSVAVLAAVVAARLSVYGPGPGSGGRGAIGLVADLINGGLIARFALQPFVVTLAMLLAARGAALTLSDNAPVMVISLKVSAAGHDSHRACAITGCDYRRPLCAWLPCWNTLASGGMCLRSAVTRRARLAGIPVAHLGRCLRYERGARRVGRSLSGSAVVFRVANRRAWLGAVGDRGGRRRRHVLTGGQGSVGSTLVGVLFLGFIFVTLNFERGQGTFQLNSFWENFIRGASC